MANHETEFGLIATKRAWDYWGEEQVKDFMEVHADFLVQSWQDGIDEGTNNYDANVIHYYHKVDLSGNNIDNMSQALKESRDWLHSNTYFFPYIDSICVLDARRLNGPSGIAYQSRAGTDFCVAYTQFRGSHSSTVVAQEIGHLYGGAHAETKKAARDGCDITDSDNDKDLGSTFESTYTQHSILGNFSQWDCNLNQSYTSNGTWFSDCTRDCIRNYMDNHL